MTDTIEPKVDQLTADHLIGRTMTIRITSVELTASEQPCEIHYEGEKGLPYRPGKSMRRVLVHVWGGDVNQYVGRSLRLYRDDDVQFGGLKVGGIRISHMSHLDDPMTMALTAKKGSKKAYKVLPLQVEEAAPAPVAQVKLPVVAPSGAVHQIPRERWLAAIGKALGGLEDSAALHKWCSVMVEHFGTVREIDEELAHKGEQLAEGRALDFRGPPEEEPGAVEAEEMPA